MLTLAVSFVAYAKREAARARREQHLTSWQLRQLIPEVCNLPTRGSSSPPPRLGLLSVQRIMVKVIR
jgi:hypothetical protein